MNDELSSLRAAYAELQRQLVTQRSERANLLSHVEELSAANFRWCAEATALRAERDEFKRDRNTSIAETASFIRENERLKWDREVYQTALAREQSAHAFTAQERDALRALLDRTLREVAIERNALRAQVAALENEVDADRSMERLLSSATPETQPPPLATATD